jgi:hypothetical protein
LHGQAADALIAVSAIIKIETFSDQTAVEAIESLFCRRSAVHLEASVDQSDDFIQFVAIHSPLVSYALDQQIHALDVLGAGKERP